MLVEVGGRKQVTWKHEIEFDRAELMARAESSGNEDLKKVLSLSVGRTVCTVTDPDGDFRAEGATYRSRKDCFDHVKGMKVSLRRAIQGFPKAERKVFWDRFLELKKEGLKLVVECV